MKRLILLAILPLFLMSCKNQKHTSLLPANGGFEADSSEWILGQATVTTDNPQSGEKCLLIANDTTHWSFADQFILIPAAAENITISGWIKTEDVLRGKETWETALLNFEFVDSTLSHIDPYPEATAEIIGTTEWTRYEKTTAVLKGSYAMKFHIALGNALGKAWFDDLQVVFTDAEGKLLSTTHLTPNQVHEIRGE